MCVRAHMVCVLVCTGTCMHSVCAYAFLPGVCMRMCTHAQVYVCVCVLCWDFVQYSLLKLKQSEEVILSDEVNARTA